MPERTIHNVIRDGRTETGQMLGYVHADLNHLEHGRPSTFTAAKFYADEATKRRDELVGKIQAERLAVVAAAEED